MHSRLWTVASDERSCKRRLISDAVVSRPRRVSAEVFSLVHDKFTTKTRRMAPDALDAVRNHSSRVAAVSGGEPESANPNL